MTKGSTVIVEANTWIVVNLDDEVTNHKELIASLKEKSGIPEQVSIADWDNILKQKSEALTGVMLPALKEA